MKRFGMGILAVAAVTLLAGRAEAQLPQDVTTATITATAEIEAILEFDVIDDQLDCDVVLVGSTACTGNGTTSDGQAEIVVSANSDWLLEFTDIGGAQQGDEVTLDNDDAGRYGMFVLDLTSDTPDPGNTGTADVNVTVHISGAIQSAGTADDQLDVTDDYGTYTGTFTVDLSATN